MKSFTYILPLILLFNSCSPRVMRTIPLHKTQNIRLEVQNTQSLNPGMSFKIKTTVTLIDGKIYTTHPTQTDHRLLYWDDIFVEVENGTFNYHTKSVLVNDKLEFTGIPDTVKVKIRANNSQTITDTKQVIVDYNSNFVFNASGRSGNSGSNGYTGNDARGDSISGTSGGNGYSGQHGKNGNNVEVNITDTLVNETAYLKCLFSTQYVTRKTMLNANKNVTILANGGNGGHGGNGGSGGRRKDGGQHKGGSGGNGGNGASGGDISLYISESAHQYLRQFNMESRQGRAGRAGRSGEGIQNTPGLAGFIVDGIFFSKKEGAPGVPGFTGGKIEVIKMLELVGF
jgi:hypothetical protein